MDQASHYNRPPLPRREREATSVTNPQWNSPDDLDLSASGLPPPPYSLYEETPPARVPRMRPAVTMPIQTGCSYNPATYSENGQSPTIPSFDPPPSRPVSRGNGYNPSQYQQPGPGPGPDPSQSLHPPNRLRVMTSMPNISSTAGRFDHSPVSSVSSRPTSPSMTAFTPSPTTTTAPNHRPWPDQSRPTTPIYHNLPPPPPPPSGPLPPPPPRRPGPRPLQRLPTSKPPTSNPAAPNPPSPNPSPTTPKSLLTSALHFAGGLIPHPYESTKHHTILRHSPALIFYRGPKTSLAITIFSSPSCPLPPDRSLWLQQRGFSGDTGLKLKQLVGATSTWLDVTPSTQVQTPDLEPGTSKAWERDIAKAVRKISREMGNEKAHVPRQTHVVRIPEAAEDGYFRLVLCVGGVQGSKEKKRKVVCQSPVFRVASTSSDSSVLRGASLSTMPIEMGVKVASFMASSVVQRYTAPVAAITDRVRPGLVKEEVGKRVFKAVGERVRSGPKENGGGGGQFYGFGGGSSTCDTMGMGTMAVGIGMGMGGMVVGGEEGPEQPFPTKFQGRVGRGTGKGRRELGMPTANLVGVPDDIKSNLRGVYFGWACLLPGRGVDPAIIAENCWYEAVIMATKSAYTSVIQETDIKVYLAHEFGDGMVSFTEAKMKVIVMGFIRPEVQPARGTVASVQDRLEMASQDVMVTMASLSRENWGPDMTLDRLKTAKSSRNLSDKFGDVKTKVQRTVDRVPGHAHVAGVRVGGGEERDRIHGTGGYWVAR